MGFTHSARIQLDLRLMVRYHLGIFVAIELIRYVTRVTCYFWKIGYALNF